MRTRLERLLDGLRTGFWFVPSLMIFLAIGLALLLLWVDEKVDPGIKSSLAWAYSGGPEGARSLLSTIAGSMITAASVTFSLASVAISIASQQYGSRVLRNFMRDRVNQVLLGTFVSTFVYSVLVVRSIRGADPAGGFVPAISVTGAIALSLVSLILLVYFVHHVSTSIQASHIVLVIADDLNQSIATLYPAESDEKNEGPADLESIRALQKVAIPKEKSGYVQSIDRETLLGVAKRNDVVVEVVTKPGDHLLSRSDVAVVWGDAKLSEEDQKRIADAFAMGGQRTPLQDVRYQFEQLTDVVVRALSPGINDPFTAINAIDALTSAASDLARRPRPPEVEYDSSGAVRLIFANPRIEDILQDSVGHIALYAAGNPFVMSALRGVLQAVEPNLTGARERRSLAELVDDLRRYEKQKAL